MTARAIAHYNLLEKIGEEGLGSVFRARDTRVGRTVALKVFPPEPAATAGCPEGLIEDARAAAALSHPNIATLFDVGHDDDGCYLAYEFVGGSPLRASMAGRPMNPRRAIELAIQVADGLAEAEAAGIVHGDVGPDTIAVTGKGAAKLLDCGMARWTRGGALRRAAALDPSTLGADAGAVVSYLSPEQALGTDSDARSDLFSLATVVYEMLTGKNPFAASSPQNTVMNVISRQPAPVSSANPQVPAELDRILAKAMAKEISQRYESLTLFAAALRGVASNLDEAAAAKPDNYMLPIDDRADRVPLTIWLAGAGGIAALAAIVWWTSR